MPITSKNADEMYRQLKSKLGNIITDDNELRDKADLAAEINALKEERNAVVLGHNYMEAALYLSIPDYTGDSFGLCQQAAKTDKDIIVFCGVKFMAETAKIINPERTVLVPSNDAGCSLAEAITAADVRRLRELYPGVPVVTYINTYADVKAECDIVCTSGNAARIVESLNSETVIFLPDEYLAGNIARETGRHIIFPDISGTPPESDTTMERIMIGWRGRCEVHEKFTVEDISTVRNQHPGVFILAHPECSPEVAAAADFAGSTREMIELVQRSSAPSFLLLTECAMGDNIMAENPTRNILRLCSQRCPHMKEISLGQTLVALQETRFEIDLPEDIRLRAKKAVDRMLEMG